MSQAKHIHLIGICGTAMASLAGLLQQKGHRITGSDQAAYPPMSGLLRSLGISIMEPFSESNLQPRPDLIIVGNAISRGNPEVEYMLDHKLPFTSMAAVIQQEFLPNRASLVVSGTHGKTTTTSMLAWIHHVAAQQDPQFAPSFLIGGVAENFGTSFQYQPGNRFLIEGDEYDTAFFDKGPKFMHYFPDALILTHVEFDHADIYRDLEAVKTAFRRLVNLVPRRGRIIAFDDSPHLRDCVQRALCPVEFYGAQPNSTWQVTDLRQQGTTMHWSVTHNGQPWAGFHMNLAGRHNAFNATAAAALAYDEGIPVESIQQALSTFRSVKRRLEVRAEINGITIIDDFAHHPTAIRETLRALRGSYPDARLWAVLEPRSNTLRRNVFESELTQSLALADRILLARVFKSEAVPEPERLQPENVIAGLTALGKPAQLMPSVSAIIEQIAAEARPGDVIAILSNGGFDDIYSKLPAALEALAGRS
ncbi:MAG: UDP-N-acetylmuramate:L-alanyl-gamma-D-glutamyl-meso-diaminopimelate ligase [Acidobacteriaceae bacterium]